MLEDLSKKELLKLLKYYDTYIQIANENNYYSDGWFPVSIDEFYNNEFKEVQELQNILKDGDVIE